MLYCLLQASEDAVVVSDRAEHPEYPLTGWYGTHMVHVADDGSSVYVETASPVVAERVRSLVANRPQMAMSNWQYVSPATPNYVGMVLIRTHGRQTEGLIQTQTGLWWMLDDLFRLIRLKRTS